MANKKEKTGKSLKDLSLKQMQKDFKKPALIVLGIAGGGLATRQIVKAINKNKAVSGLLGVNMGKLKQYILPSATILTGLGASQLIKNPEGKLIATGVAINGTVLLANQVLNTTLLAGLGEIDTEEPAPDTPEPADNYVELAPVLYEPEGQPMGYASAYIDSMMQDVEGVHATPPYVPEPEPEPVKSEPEETEVNLESNRPEDNFEMARPGETGQEANVSGNLEAIILEPEPEGYQEREFDEELDFSAIP